MRPLPIPVSASPAHFSTEWWMKRSHPPSFLDYLRAFFPKTNYLPESQLQGPWVNVQVIEFWWVQVTQVHRVQMGNLPVVAPPAKPTRPPRDPLVVDLRGEGPSTTGLLGAKPFDLAGNGMQNLTSFVSGGSAFLALDSNGNGRIDTGKELFGDQHGAEDGYEELRKYDVNHDALINGEDPVFSRLQLLFGDGRLTSVSAAGLQAFSLNAQADRGLTPAGDPIFRRATALTTQGTTLNTYALGLNQFSPASATITPAPP